MKRTPFKHGTTALPRKRSKPRKGAVRDPEYLAWVHTQPSVVPSGYEAEAWAYMREYWGRGLYPALTGKIEAHHHVASNDHATVPIPDFLHNFTPYSVHGGGGRRRFEQRVLVPEGKTFQGEIDRLRQRYLARNHSRSGESP